MMASITRKLALAATTAIILATTACAASSTPYQPLSSASRISGGYSDLRLGRGTPPNGNLRSFDAREVCKRLGPQIEYPTD